MAAVVLSRYIINFFDGLSIVLLIAVLFPIKREWGRIFLFSLLASLLFGTDFLLTYIIFPDTLFMLSAVSAIISSFSVIFVSVKIFRTSYKKMFFVFFFFYIFNTGSALVLQFIFNLLNIKLLSTSTVVEVVPMIVGSTLNLLITCIIYYVIWIIKPVVRFSGNIRNKYLAFFLVNLFFMAIMLWTFVRTHDKWELLTGKKDILASAVFLFMIVFYFLFMLFFTMRVLRTDRFEQELELEKFYNFTLEMLAGDLRRVKHNYDNSLAVIYGYASHGETDELNRYLEEIIGQNNHHHTGMPSLLNIKNAGLGAIVSSKLKKAEENDVEVSVKVPYPVHEIKMRISDLCEAVGILLDNAIEAAMESMDKRVRLELVSLKGEVRISIENHFGGSVPLRQMKEKGWSTKGDHRGLGLWIADQLVKKNRNCVLNSSIHEDLFKQELIIDENMLRPAKSYY